MQIDLSELVGSDGKVLAGMERGVAARSKFALDDLDRSVEEIVVTAPNSLVAITPSFVQGFLAGSLTSLGEDKLRKKYHFELSELLMEDISEGIEHLLMKRKFAGLN